MTLPAKTSMRALDFLGSRTRTLPEQATRERDAQQPPHRPGGAGEAGMQEAAGRNLKELVCPLLPHEKPSLIRRSRTEFAKGWER